MPSSDVYSWAKSSTKPSYTWNEIGSKPTTFTPSNHGHTVLDTPDNRSVNTTPNDYNAAFKITGLKYTATVNNPIGCQTTYVTTMGIRAWRDPSGGQSVELAFGSTNNIWVRSGDSTAWNNPWVNISRQNSQTTVVQSGAPALGSLWAW